MTLTAVGGGMTTTDPGGLSAAQSFTATVVTAGGAFTDDPIVAGVTRLPHQVDPHPQLREVDGADRAPGDTGLSLTGLSASSPKRGGGPAGTVDCSWAWAG